MSADSVLVIDAGTSSVRGAIVDADATVTHERGRDVLPSSPADGMVEFDPAELMEASLTVAREVLEAAGEPVAGVGVSCQRASTIVWERATGEALGVGVGWQDLRTVGRCLELQADGLRLAPNQTATKAEWLLDQVDPDRTRDLCVGTVDSWLVWHLTEGKEHVTDATNAGVTGLVDRHVHDWDDARLDALRLTRRSLGRIVDSSGVLGAATALPGAPPVVAVVGDQQASLIGQGGVHRGDAKVTFGTGGMLDVVLGDEAPSFAQRGTHGSFPIVAWRRGGRNRYGVEAVMLAAGTNVEWLRDGLGIVATSSETDEVAARCDDTGGVYYVPALLGLGTPEWDFGARGTFVGITRGTGRPEMVRAVLEGIAHRAADLVEAAEADADVSIPRLRVDGGMARNRTFMQAVADATGRIVERSPVQEATTLGAGLLALLAVGRFEAIEDLAGTWRPHTVVEPRAPLDRAQWREAVARATRWIEPLSAVDF